MNHSKEEIEYAFETFVESVQQLVNEHYLNDHYLTAPQIVVRGGSKYWKVVRREQHGDSVYGFVRKEDGAILKAASWSAPFVKGPSAVRGYVTDPQNGMSSVDWHGVVYAR